MLKECLKVCQEHDDNWKITTLDFSQCYVGYIKKIVQDTIYIQEFNPSYHMVINKITFHKVNKKLLNGISFDVAEDSFNKLLLRFNYDDNDIYYCFAPSAFKTMHVRLRAPTYPSIETAMIIAKNIETLNIDTRYIVYQQLSSNVYIIQAIFSHKPLHIPWLSWQEFIRPEQRFKLLSWDYSINEGLRIDLILDCDHLLCMREYPDSLLLPFYSIQLDSTGHVSNSVFGGFYLKNQPGIKFLISQTILNHFEGVTNLSKLYYYSHLELQAQLFQYLKQFKHECLVTLTFNEFQSFVNVFFISNTKKLIQYIGKKTVFTVHQYIQNYTSTAYTSFTLKYLFLKAIEANLITGSYYKRFYLNGGEYIFSKQF